MVLSFNVFAVLHYLVAAFTFALAWQVYQASPRRHENQRLAAFLAASSGLVLFVAMGFTSDSPAVVYGAMGATWMVVWWYPFLYLHFISTFETGLTRPLRTRAGQRVLRSGIWIALVGSIVTLPLAVTAIIPFEPLVPLRPVWSPWFDWSQRILAVLSLYSTVVVLMAWRRASPTSARRNQLGWYTAAAVTYDVLVIGRAGFLWPALATAVRAGQAPPEWLVSLTLLSTPGTVFVFSLLLGYASLKAHVFDIDLKIKWTLSRGTLVAIFLAAFFIVGVIAENWLTDRYGLAYGGAAAGLLLFALNPLQRLADRVSDAAMPHVRDTEEYRLVRKHQVYRAALESAYGDGHISDLEKDILATLADELGLSATDARAMEREVVA